jgi:hypothetical protein
MPSGTVYVTFISGLDVVSMAATVDGDMITTTIPSVASGQSYAILTNANCTSAPTNAQVIAGPAILEITPNSPTFDTSIL